MIDEFMLVPPICTDKGHGRRRDQQFVVSICVQLCHDPFRYKEYLLYSDGRTEGFEGPAAVSFTMEPDSNDYDDEMLAIYFGGVKERSLLRPIRQLGRRILSIFRV